jgi:NTP pyrophosphatase (non-canonical NTP hydrolase)
LTVDFDRYQQLAIVTKNKDLSERDYRIMTYTGLSGESGELMELVLPLMFGPDPMGTEEISSLKAKARLEMGDLWWYAATCADSWGLKLSDVCANLTKKLKHLFVESTPREPFPWTIEFPKLVAQLIVSVSGYVDYQKKVFFHGHPAGLFDIGDRLSVIADMLAQGTLALFPDKPFSEALEEVLASNIAKLKARYPQGFTEADSLNRKA